VRVAAHRPIEEVHHRPVLLQFLHKQNLMHVVARQPVRCRDQDAVQPRTRSEVAEPVQAGAPEACAAEAVVTKNVFRSQRPTLRRGMSTQALDLLVSRPRLDLTLGRDPSIGGYLHGGSPPKCPRERPERRSDREVRRSFAEAADRLCPIAAALLGGRPAVG